MKTLFTTAVVVSLAIGWTLWPRAAHSHGAITTTVLFDREIVRILNNRCVACHVEGGIAFPLSTYEETWVRGRAIRAEILRHHMPPWAAVPGYGEFANDNGLTLREMQFLVSWVEGLGPRNAGTVFLNVSDPKAAVRREVRAEAHAGHWQLGEPDLIRPLEARVDAKQEDFVRRSVIDLGLTSDRRIRAIEYLPGDRRVVRGAVFTLQQTGQWLGSWTPWYGFTKLPDGVTAPLPSGSRIVADVYYRGAAQAVVDRGQVGLFFADREATQTRANDLVLTASRDPKGTYRASTRLTADTHVWALRPDVDRDVDALEVSARRADGGTDILLYARDARAAWPTPYILKKPVLVPRGSQISFVVRINGDVGAGRNVRMIVARY